MRRFLLVLLALAASILAGALIAQRESRSAPAHLPTPNAYGVTPAPWLSIAGPFDFCYRYPETVGCAPAEDKTSDPFVRGFKIDIDRARADCLRWTAVGAVPAAQLARDTTCSGGTRLVGGIYWFDAPTAITPPPPSPSPPASLPPPAATVSPVPGATTIPTATPELVIPAHVSSVWFYLAGSDGLGGKVGDVSWCEGCDEGRGVWNWGVDQDTLVAINKCVLENLPRATAEK